MTQVLLWSESEHQYISANKVTMCLHFRVKISHRKSGRRWGLMVVSPWIAPSAQDHWQVWTHCLFVEKYLASLSLSINYCTCNLSVSESGMGRMMPGSMSSCLSSLPQHRKCQYPENGIAGAHEKPVPQKSYNYTQYNMLASTKTEGEQMWL